MAEMAPCGNILNIQETRLTNLFMHVLCSITLFALNLLKLIPVPVLYVRTIILLLTFNPNTNLYSPDWKQGIFLFMGLVSLGTNTFWLRTTMFFMQPSRYP